MCKLELAIFSRVRKFWQLLRSSTGSSVSRLFVPHCRCSLFIARFSEIFSETSQVCQRERTLCSVESRNAKWRSGYRSSNDLPRIFRTEISPTWLTFNWLPTELARRLGNDHSTGNSFIPLPQAFHFQISVGVRCRSIVNFQLAERRHRCRCSPPLLARLPIHPAVVVGSGGHPVSPLEKEKKGKERLDYRAAFDTIRPDNSSVIGSVLSANSDDADYRPIVTPANFFLRQTDVASVFILPSGADLCDSFRSLINWLRGP